MQRACDSTGTRWEPLVGLGDPTAQAEEILQNIEAALKALGGRLEHVARTREMEAEAIAP